MAEPVTSVFGRHTALGDTVGGRYHVHGRLMSAMPGEGWLEAGGYRGS
jgi:hypothetical protein